MKRPGRWPHSLRGERAQALPVAIGALAIGAILITPLLTGASTSSRYTRQVGARAIERYSMDAGVEWSGWRLMSNPLLTSDTSFTATPLEPLPAAINGAAFPQTEIRYIPAAGAFERVKPAWQGGGDQCYAVSASEAGTLSVRAEVDSGQMWMELLAGGAPCTRTIGLPALPGTSPYGADFTLSAAGDYQVLIGTDTATTGTVEMSVPAATYEVRSVSGARNVIARLVAGYSGVRVASWQLN